MTVTGLAPRSLDSASIGKPKDMFKRHPLSVLFPALMVTAGPVMAVDTGDAPASYGTASHEVVANGPFLGTILPDDNDPVATAAADGDDIANGDDEDGVTTIPVLFQNIKAYSLTVAATNPSSVDATYTAWIDFDGNGIFDADEASAPMAIPAGTGADDNLLLWPSLVGIATDFIGTSYMRVRITTDALGNDQAASAASDGEVEDYVLEFVADTDGDTIPDQDDPDDDNDGIPDTVDGVDVDTDGDGIDNPLDTDSDNDGISDAEEAGPAPETPVDTDSDGTPDFIDTDSNNDGTPDSGPGDVSGPGDDSGADADSDGLADSVEGAGDADGDGILNILDIDSDNDTILDAIEAGDTESPIDTDADGIPDFLDLDSDNDGIPDLYEASAGEIDTASLDADGDGRVDSGLVFGANGLVDSVETSADSGTLIFQLVDTDGDGSPDYIDTDSDNDGLSDTIESGGQDADGNGVVDALVDSDSDGIDDNVDASITGGADTDSDGIDDAFDSDFIPTADTDSDGIVDASDLDANGDGIVDDSNAIANGGLLDDDNDGIPDFQDTDDSQDTDTGGGVPPAPPVSPPQPPVDTDGDDVPRIETGLDGFAGCSIIAGNGSGFDPVLLLLMLSALGVLARGRLANRRPQVVRVQPPKKM